MRSDLLWDAENARQWLEGATVTRAMEVAAQKRCDRCIRTEAPCSPDDCNRRRLGAMLAASPATDYLA